MDVCRWCGESILLVTEHGHAHWETVSRRSSLCRDSPTSWHEAAVTTTKGDADD